jgi:hypothetical protein
MFTLQDTFGFVLRSVLPDGWTGLSVADMRNFIFFINFILNIYIHIITAWSIYIPDRSVRALCNTTKKTCREK